MGTFDQRESHGWELADDAIGDGQTLPDQLPQSPWGLIRQWFDEAHAKAVQPNPNAMTLATVDPDGRPSARIVLCKELDDHRGSVVFYTNYHGRKGAALDRTPRAAAVFHWDALDRQVRIEGPVHRTTDAESDAYFATRPWESQIGAWASDQSRPIQSRDAFLAKVMETMARFGVMPLDQRPGPGNIPRPPHWGGFRLWSERVELWVSGVGRLHDRAAWTRTVAIDPATHAARPGDWASSRLQP